MVRPSIHATNGTETLTQICQIFYYISDSFFRKLSELAMDSIGLSGDFWVQLLLSVARSCKATDSARMARPLGLCANPKRTRSQSTMPSLTSSELQISKGADWLGRYYDIGGCHLSFSSRLVFRTTKQTKPSTKEEEIHIPMPSKGHLKILMFNSFINFKSIKWKLQYCSDNHTRHGLVTRDSSIATSAAPRMKVQQNQLTVGTGGSPKNSIVWWSKCNKTPLFTVFSAHTQIASMLMLREHMSCLFATIRRFFMTCVDTFSSQHIETA